jgi:hypothetical protein
MNDVIKEFSMSRRDAENMTKNVLMEVTTAVANAWKSAARKELHSTRSNYIKSIYIVEEGRLSNAIVLGGSFNNMLENGSPSFDMKSQFANSPKRKISASGKWYMRIPFRFASSGSLGENEAFSGVLPAAIYKAVNSMSSSKTDLGGAKKSGSSLKAVDIPAPYNSVSSRAAIVDPITKKNYEEYKHKSSIYEGISKSTKEYGSATQGTYNSFRTVGQNSDSNAFIYPGLLAHDFANKGLKSLDVDTIVNNSIDKFLSSL